MITLYDAKKNNALWIGENENDLKTIRFAREKRFVFGLWQIWIPSEGKEPSSPEIAFIKKQFPNVTAVAWINEVTNKFV